MFNRKPDVPQPNLDKAIDKAFEDLKGHHASSTEYVQIMKQIDQLYALRYPDLKKSEPRKPIDPNTLLVIGANLLGIVAILGYEHGHAVTSKALGFVLKTKV